MVFDSGRETLKGLDIARWQAEEGDQVVLFGPSGSGKSTFLHILAGLLPISKGKLTVCKHSLEKNIFLWLLFMVLFFSLSWGSNAEGCAACVAAGQLAKENQNRALYALRILYEKEGRAALPTIRESLKSNDNPPLQIRAAGYVVELKDTDSVPLLEEILSELVKRVTFSTFGVRSAEFQTRLFVAHSLAKLGSTRIADRIWERYDQINLQRKMEVPYILNALGDPRLTERLSGIISRSEDHQLMMVTLDVLAMGGNSQTFALPPIEARRMARQRRGDLWIKESGQRAGLFCTENQSSAGYFKD